MNWEKQHRIYERKAYRIVQSHIKNILTSIPLGNVSLNTYEALIISNISEDKIKAMLVDVYSTIGLDYGVKINKTLEKITKADNILFNETLLKEILLFLSTDGGKKIVSIQNTLIEDVIKAIQSKLTNGTSLANLRDIIFEIGKRSGTFYKYQALRIARTETTASANFSAMATASKSKLLLEKEWISVQDNRTRVTPYDHFDMNKQKQDLDKPFLVGGEEIMYAGDPNASAGNVINCRCSVAFVPKRDKDGNLILK